MQNTSARIKKALTEKLYYNTYETSTSVLKDIYRSTFSNLLNFEAERGTPEKHAQNREIFKRSISSILAFCRISFRSEVTEVWKSWSDKYLRDC